MCFENKCHQNINVPNNYARSVCLLFLDFMLTFILVENWPFLA